LLPDLYKKIKSLKEPEDKIGGKIIHSPIYVWKRQLTIILQLQSWLTIMKSSRN
jgi:hypothetical protein